MLIYREMTQEQLTARVQSRARPGESVDIDRLVAIHAAFESFVTTWDRSPVVRIPAHVDVLTEDGLETALAGIATVWEPPFTR